MIPVPSALSRAFTWSKVPSSRSYQLKQDNEIIGTLSRPSFWSTTFVAQTQHGRWTFRRCGFLGTGATILEAERPIATFKAAWSGGGLLTFSDGQTFHLECKGWWRPVWSVLGENGQAVMHLHSREKTVDLPAKAAVPEPRLSLLVMFVWYRVLEAEQDAATAATVAVIVAS